METIWTFLKLLHGGGGNSFNVNLQTADRGSVSFLYPCRIKLFFSHKEVENTGPILTQF